MDRCVEELKNDKWVLPALKQIREICMLYSEAPPNFNHAQRSPHMFYRHEVINRLQQHHSLVILVADNLTAYMNRAHVMAKGRVKIFLCSMPFKKASILHTMVHLFVLKLLRLCNIRV